MRCLPSGRPGRSFGRAWAIAFAFLLSLTGATAAHAAATGKIQGRVLAADTGEPLGFADISLIPDDTTMRRVGTLANADGTFLIEAAPGRYTLQIRALSYARKRVEGIVIEADRLIPFETALASEAIQQEEVVVEAKARQNSEASMLQARKKAVSVGDAVSAEQVRKSPDKDAAEVLRRVTGLSVSDGKYVFVRGLGERYSSVEVDGVRIASPEENKRVVPLDLVPAALLENIVVQKTYTADRPGEFGGGDVQVRTKDFPGRRVVSFTLGQSVTPGVTFEDRKTYAGSDADRFGYGAPSRRLPDEVLAVASDRKLTRGLFTQSSRADLAKSFRNVWVPNSARAPLNSGYAITYGDEFRPFGGPLGVTASWSFTRSLDHEDRRVTEFRSSLDDTIFNVAEERYTETAQLGGIAGLSYRLSPRHTVHLRGLYTNSADDEVRTYVGPDHNSTDMLGNYLWRHSTRLMYVQRNVLSGSVGGQHTVAQLLGSTLDWKLTRSQANREQPDRREVIYSRNYYYDGDGNPVEYWALSSNGLREYGDLEDDGRGAALSASLPYRLGSGGGKILLGYDRQSKDRVSTYRRFSMISGRNGGLDPTLPPDSLFDYSNRSDTLGYVEETTLDIDNYKADQRVEAAYVAADVPLSRSLRANVGVRFEDGFQDVRSYDFGVSNQITSRGTLENRDWMPSANVTWAMTEKVNLRLGASRTVSRPDLNELSPSPALEYYAGFRVAGNPDLERALIDNYDIRIEAFPGLSEVLAAGFFYKKLHRPIERTITGATAPLLVPRNSEGGRNLGVEVEARAGLGRLWHGLNGFSLNFNGSLISSEIHLQPSPSRLGTTVHPLQGQANYLANVALGYTSTGGHLDVAVLLGSTGKRLRTLAYDPLPDIYDAAVSTLDVTMNLTPIRGYRIKLAAKNLLDPRIQSLQGGKEVVGYHNGRAFSMALAFGS